MRFFTLILLIAFAHEVQAQKHFAANSSGQLQLTLQGANHLASLPLKCMQQEFPYKTGITFPDTSLIQKPRNYHPAFYGCFDWHSSVHGHWMLVRLLKLFPGMQLASEARTKLQQNLSAENISKEVVLFKSKHNRSFERTYGWAWVLMLQKELNEWNDPFGRELSGNLQPLSSQLSLLYRDYLSKLVYPVRTGEHPNLAFGLRLAWDYAQSANDDSLLNAIKTASFKFYSTDVACPLNYEPGGTDFLSPCLEEADLMWRILPPKQYQSWLSKFLPQLLSPNIKLEPGKVNDRTDGKLVHLDGLNLSRAWCLYGISRAAGTNSKALKQLANKHLLAALPNVASGDYMGEHWLASFAVYALTMQDL